MLHQIDPSNVFSFLETSFEVFTDALVEFIGRNTIDRTGPQDFKIRGSQGFSFAHIPCCPNGATLKNDGFFLVCFDLFDSVTEAIFQFTTALDQFAPSLWVHRKRVIGADPGGVVRKMFFDDSSSECYGSENGSVFPEYGR